TDTQTEFIENQLLDLAIDGDTDATQQYADLYLSRLNWERTRTGRTSLIKRKMRRLGSRLIPSGIGLPESRESKVKKERFRGTESGEGVPCHGGRVRCPVCSRLLDTYHPRWEYNVKGFRMMRHATVRVHFIKPTSSLPKVR